MERASCPRSPDPAGRDSQAGATLAEVLVAILIMGVGLLALLTLFPLGALNMAQEIKDDRTAAVAESAAALSEAGQALLLDTGHFVEDSIAQGSIDPVAAAELRGKYELLKDQADDLEVRLEELRSMFPHQLIEPHVGPLLAQIHAIKARLKAVMQLLSLLARHA
jgi:Prokaryotic N-terminal methylation motif